MKCFLAIAVLSMRALICCKANRDVDGRISVENDIISFESNTRAYLRKGDVSIKYLTIPNPPIGDFGQDLPEELKQSQLIDPLKLYEPRDISLKHSPTGKFPNLVLMLRFSDHKDRELPTREDISRLYNSEEVTIDDTKVLEKGDDPIPTGSVRQWYFSNSHSTFTIDTTVVGWIDLPNTEKYYADGQHGLSKSKFKEAMKYGLNTLDGPDKPADFDFSHFDLDTNGYLDGFGVLTSGYGAEFSGADCFGANPTERIWSHKGGIDWSSSDGAFQVNRFYVSSSVRGKCKSNIVRIGVLCHELGHYLGVPDLYDPSFKGNGLGAYDVMSQSWGFSGGGVWPPNLSAWSKLELGWATTELIEQDGTFEAPVSNPTSPYKVFKITHGFKDGEYLLLENRQPLGYDSKIPHGGIAIYHVDENQKSQKDRGYPSQEGWPQNGKHYKVALLEASGKFNLEEAVNQGDEGDLWHAGSTLKELIPGNGQYPNTDSYQGGVVGTGVRIFGFSDSGAMMTFQVEGLLQGQTADATEEPTSSPTHSPTKCEEIEISTNHCDLCNEALAKIKSNEDEERKQLIARIGEMEAEIAEREMQMINMNSNNNGNGELAKELQEEMDHLKRKHERESNLMSNRIAELEDELAASWQSSSSSNDVQSRKIQELRRDMSDNADKILELENEIDERDKLLRTSNKATDILLDNMEAQKREYEKELDRTASLVNELEEAIANREEEMSTLQERFEALERLAGELNRREVVREEEAAAAAEANAASNQFQFADAMRMSEENMGQQQQAGMGMGVPSPRDESSGEGNQQWQMEREARLAAEQEVGKLMGYLKDREQQINQMQQQQGGSQQGGSEGNSSPFGAFGALFGVGGGGGDANAQQNQQNWGNWQPNNEESMENYEMLNQVLMPDEVSQRGGQQSTQMPGAGRSENIWEGAPAGAGAGRSENIREGAAAGASSFMSGAGRSDNIRDGMGSASFGATPSPSAVATPSGGQLPTPAMAFERRLAENPIVPSGAFGGSKPTASFFSKTSNQGSGGGVPTDTPEYYQNAMNNFDSRPPNRGDSMEAPAMPPIESFQQRPTAPSPRQAARPGATESIYAGAGSASDNIYAGAGSASAYPRPSPARQEPPAPPPAPLPTPAAAFEQRLAENPIVPSGAFGGKAPTARFFSQESAPPPNMGSSSQQSSSPSPQSAPPPNMGSSSQQSSFPSPPGDDSQSKWLNMDENQKKRVAADAYKAFEKSLKNSRPDQNKGPKGGSALGSTGLGGRGAVASKGQTDSPASSAPAPAPANAKQRQASQVEDERKKHQEMVRAASKQQSAPKSAATTSSTLKSNTTSKQTQQQSAEQIQASAAQASAKRMSLAERAAKAEHDRKDRERQMKAEARRARDAQYASRGPSLSERAAQPDQDREIREAQLKEQARKAQEAQRVEELSRAQEVQHLEELKRAAEADAKRVVEINRAEDLKRKADADLQSALELERRLVAEMANPDAAPTKQKSEGRLETKEQIEAALLGAEEEQGEQQWPVEKKKRQATGQGFKKEKVAAGAKKKRVVAGYNVVVMKDPKGSVDMPQILEGSLKDLLKGDQSNSNRRRSSMGDNNY